MKPDKILIHKNTRKTMKKFFCILVIFYIFTCLDASCYFNPIKTEYQENSNEPQLYCETIKGDKLDVGSDYKTDDCFYCRCLRAGLQCCGYGYKTGVEDKPAIPGCKWISGGDPDGCGLIQVKDCRTKHCHHKYCYFDCDTGEKINHIHRKIGRNHF